MKKLFILLLAGVLGNSAMGQTVPRFKNGDRIVFTGNSITDGGHYHSYIWLYYLTRFPDMQIKIFNAGIGGDVCRQMYERLETDVFSHRPTVVTLTFGMNDTGYSGDTTSYSTKVPASLQSFHQIEQVFVRHSETRKILIGSSPYDETANISSRSLKTKNRAMLQIADAEQHSAQQHGWGFVDFNRPMTAINGEQQKNDPAFTMEGTDRIHPTNDGHMVMAYLFLKAQGLAGKKVAEVQIEQNTLHTDNCKVTSMRNSGKNISFDYLANALPYPVDTIGHGANSPRRTQADGLKLVPFAAEFNQELLIVKGLKAGKYTLHIDNIYIGRWSAAELQEGINLAEYSNTPQYQQALAVMHINEERWEIERRLREYWWLHYSILKPKGLLFNDSQATLDTLYKSKDFFVAATLPTYKKARFKAVRDTWEKEIALLTTQMYTVNKPVTHHFEITYE